MGEDEFTRLFQYIQTEFKKVEDRFDGMDTRFDTLTNAVDAFAKQNETYMQEMLALAHKVDRLEKWITQIAAKTGVKLEY